MNIVFLIQPVIVSVISSKTCPEHDIKRLPGFLKEFEFIIVR